jgi:hypothetical protein
MFSDAGARASLRKFGPVSEAAVQAVHAFAEETLRRIGHPRVLVSVHNNTQGRYGLASYQPRGSEAANAQAVHAEPGLSADNFFLVTDPALFNALKARRQNVVLQAPDPADDGSLSSYAARNGISYVLVEAKHGELFAQKRMLRTLMDVLGMPAR